MKKLKKFYVNNRIYCILMILSLICIFLIAGSVVFYFINQTKTSVYGSRLDGIENYDLSEDTNKINEYLDNNTAILSHTVRLQGKILYIEYKVADDAKVEDVTTIASSILENISDENKNFFDVQFIVYRDSYDAYFGSKSSSKSVITWAHTYDTTNNNEETTTTTVSNES